MKTKRKPAPMKKVLPKPVVTVYQPGTLGGQRLTAQQIRHGIASHREDLGFRALVQLIEAQAALHQAEGQRLENQVNGAGVHYVSRSAALSDLLVKVQSYAFPELQVELKEEDYL